MSRTTNLIFGVYFIKIYVEWMTKFIDQLVFPYFLFSMVCFIFVFDSFIYIYKYMTWYDYIHALLPSVIFFTLTPSSSLVPMGLWLKDITPTFRAPIKPTALQEVVEPRGHLLHQLWSIKGPQSYAGIHFYCVLMMAIALSYLGQSVLCHFWL